MKFVAPASWVIGVLVTFMAANGAARAAAQAALGDSGLGTLEIPGSFAPRPASR